MIISFMVFIYPLGAGTVLLRPSQSTEFNIKFFNQNILLPTVKSRETPEFGYKKRKFEMPKRIVKQKIYAERLLVRVEIKKT